MHLKPKNQNGFSLIELMVVVGIMGVMATLAMPKLNTFMAKSKQAEAKSGLSSIYQLQMTYFNAFDTYSTDVGTLGFTMPDNRYTYSMTNASDTGFNAQANVAAGGLGTGCSDDAWGINVSKTLRRLSGTVLTCN
ncbi:MAG: type II secretion system protein [Proteobacteria bacterium]|nr:type II secretion system protein [Pseudomonadota bacterium]